MACHSETGPAYNQSTWTTYGCQNWSAWTTYGCQNWSPGPHIWLPELVCLDHIWLPELVPRTTYGCHNWSPGPLMAARTGPPGPHMAATTGPPDHLWLPQLVLPSPGGSKLQLAIDLEASGSSLYSTYINHTDPGRPFWRQTTYGMNSCLTEATTIPRIEATTALIIECLANGYQ